MINDQSTTQNTHQKHYQPILHTCIQQFLCKDLLLWPPTLLNQINLLFNYLPSTSQLLINQSPPVVAHVTIHDKGDTRRGDEMYLPTMKVRASLRMKGMREWRLWGKDSKWGSFVGQIRVALNDMKAVRDCTHSLKSIFNATLISPTNEPHLELRLWVIMLLLELSNCHH